MSDDVQRSLGEISGKLDFLIDTVKEQGKVLLQHSEDINQAKGAKATLIWGGGILSAMVAAVVAEAHRLFTR